jgi:hypothetical protein
LLVFDAVSVISGAKIGSVRDTTGAAKVGGYYVEDLIGSSTEFKETGCFCCPSINVEMMRMNWGS